MKISVVSPVYMSDKIVAELVLQITKALKELTEDFEIILIDDGSSDNSWSEIKKQCHQYKFVKGVKLSRNFGQHNAIRAGFNLVSGDCCIVMDCDLQDDPVYIKELVKNWKEGYDIVYTYKKRRKHSFFKNFGARIFNMIFNYLVENKSYRTDRNVGSFSLVSKKVITAFNRYNDYQFHYLMVLRWLGFEECYVEIEHKKRLQGKSSYNFKKLLEHGIIGIVFQSDKLLRMSIYVGFSFSLVAMISVIVVVVKYFMYGFQPGWASLIVVILFSTGLILMAIGVLGLYLSKMFEQVKNRPKFIVDKKVNF